MFEIFRTAFDQNGKPMRVTVTIFPVDRQQFIIDIGKVPLRSTSPRSGQNDTSGTRVPHAEPAINCGLSCSRTVSTFHPPMKQ